ncbi:MAG: SDR family oxidoreductase, partial [Dehalococcoidia bacterium]|nr:SDR family oxidoreductase [Dehalococcoidia bacterium]
MRFTNRFEGRVALLTGSAASAKGELMGFGGATAWRFLEEGGRGVVITDVQDDVGERAAKRMRDAGHDALFLHLDVTEEQEWSTVVEATLTHFGRLDILVNIAGILDPQSILDIEPDAWKKTMEISTVGIFLGTRAVALPMEQSGGGAIVNLGSIGWMIKDPIFPAYAAAKAAIEGLTRVMARELGPDKIRVNSVVPGWIMTERQLALWVTPEAQAN